MKMTPRLYIFVAISMLIFPSMAKSASFPVKTSSTQEKSNKDKHLVVRDGVIMPSSNSPEILQGFFIIENKSPNDMLLQNITSPICDRISANHSDQVKTSNDSANFDIFKHLAVPHASVMVFPKEGYHLVCYKLKQQEPVKDTAPFTFHFLGGLNVTADFSYQNHE
ncbi:copper chaperone PCu(A)C [Aristophania vespae]|uniref:copper chaperone PCu(A)C n=1 Tax=Aristophania vespae TaxID=2697033 RepID=UPI0023516F45|nr:copper chaperone PCu(A)C [Aristophania vespae]UMM63200.1 hypothetical protein DM15PD_01560 [Aristophania vespae]